MQLVPIARDRHATKKVRSPSSYAFARGEALVPIFGAELGRAAHQFPIAFSRGNDGVFPAALMGLEAGKNLFVGQAGNWVAGYVPAMLRRAPFMLARVGDASDLVLCVDEDSELVGDEAGERLFADDGTPTQYVSQIFTFLGELERSRAATLSACKVLDQHGLLAEWDLKVAREDQSVQRIGGLLRMDEAKLNQLSPEALAEVRDSGALVVGYSQLFSQDMLPLLGRLAAAHAQAHAQQKAVQQRQGNVDFDRVFGIVDDDPFQF